MEHETRFDIIDDGEEIGFENVAGDETRVEKRKPVELTSDSFLARRLVREALDRSKAEKLVEDFDNGSKLQNEDDVAEEEEDEDEEEEHGEKPEELISSKTNSYGRATSAAVGYGAVRSLGWVGDKIASIPKRIGYKISSIFTAIETWGQKTLEKNIKWVGWIPFLGPWLLSPVEKSWEEKDRAENERKEKEKNRGKKKDGDKDERKAEKRSKDAERGIGNAEKRSEQKWKRQQGDDKRHEQKMEREEKKLRDLLEGAGYEDNVIDEIIDKFIEEENRLHSEAVDDEFKKAA